MKKIFTSKILEWHLLENKRTMPWKGEKDPYRIWISEIILQQTRVKQGLAYYNNFIEQFPTLISLALAKDEVVFKMWEGLGYYTRCKNLLFTARYIINHLNGSFPSRYKDILSLKGIGPYTAAAISSFAYGLPHAVADGNVLRVLSRYFGEAVPIDSSKGKIFYNHLANELLPEKTAGAYNQAIMDFGATICKPQLPQCGVCVLRENCIALKEGLVNRLPIKEKQVVKRTRFFTYFIFWVQDEVLVNKRTGKDIWQNLYEFYLLETNTECLFTAEEIKSRLRAELEVDKFVIQKVSGCFTQQLTHQFLKGSFITIILEKVPSALKNFTRIKTENLSSIAFPKFINQYLHNNQLL